MVNNMIKSSLIQCHATDTFHMKGLMFTLEKQNSLFDPKVDLDENGNPKPINIQIKRIDAIFNPEFEKLQETYRLPIFFKSLAERSDKATYAN